MKNYIFLFFSLLLLGGCASKKALSPDGNKLSTIDQSKKISFEHFYYDALKHFTLGNYNQAKNLFEKSLQVLPNEPSANFHMARIYMQNNQADKALPFILKSVKADEKNIYYQVTLAKVYEQTMQLDDALKVYEKVVLLPKSSEYYYDIATVYLYQKKYAEAISAYDTVETIFGMSPDLTRQKQQLWIKLNRLDKAFEEGDKLMENFPDDLDAKVDHAEFLYNNKKETEATELLDEVMKKDSAHIKGNMLYADIYESRGDKDKALFYVGKVFGNPNADFNAKLQIFESLYKLGDSPENIKKLDYLSDKLIEAHPIEGLSYGAKGDVYVLKKEKKSAWEVYCKAANFEATSYNLWMQLVTLDSELNQIDSAVVHGDKAVQNFPNQPVFYLYYGNALSMKKKHQEAIDIYEEGKRIAGSNLELKNYFNIYLGDTYNSVKEYKKSDQAYEEVLKFDKNNDHVLNNYSYFLSLRKEKLELAKEMSGRLVKKYPTDPTYVDTYAWVLYMMKDYNGALEFLQGIAVDSKNGTIVEHYGDVLYQLGKKDEALGQWKKAKSLGETSEFIDKKIADKKLYE